MYFPSFIPILTLLELLAAQSTSVVSDIASPSDVPVCYSPDKSVAIDNYACNLSANVSVCCGVGSICLDNKICQNGNDQIIRGACTDSTWQSPECPQYCMGKSMLLSPTRKIIQILIWCSQAPAQAART